MNDIDVEGQSLEERNSILATHLLQNHSEFVIRDLLDKVALELHNNVISSENGAESIALLPEEAEAVAFKNERVVEAGLNARLCRHDREVFHVLETLVANLNCEGEGLRFGVHISGTDLLELNLCQQLLNRLLDDRILLIHDINDELWGIKSEGVCSRVISAELRRDSWDACGCKDPVRSLTWRCVAKKIMRCAYL